MSKDVQKHLDLLGFKVKDKVTGAKGIVVGVSFDLYGCIQALITTGCKASGEFKASKWKDVSRLKKLGNGPKLAGCQPSLNSVMAVLDKLGRKATDCVTGKAGVVTSLNFELWGEKWISIDRGYAEDGTAIDNSWHPMGRWEIHQTNPVMQQPNYNRGYVAKGRQGSAEKPVHTGPQ